MSLSRRQVLTGAAGFSLALPMLPSLLPRRAFASDPDAPQRFIAFGTEHGGIWQENLYPSESTLTESRSYVDWTIHRGDLNPTVRDGQTELSRVLRASSAVLTPSLVNKMNVLRGFDWPFYMGHHQGAHLGNPGRNSGNGSTAEYLQTVQRPTIDQVLAWSDRFYQDTSSIQERSLVIGRPWMSSGYSDPANQRGDIDALPAEFNSLSIFNRIFRDSGPASRKPVVDLVIEDYRRLRDSDRRLSSGDRRRLNEHMERLFELERRLNAERVCEDIPEPTENSLDVRRESGFSRSPDRQIHAWQLMNDVLVAALACDTSRIATCRLTETFHTYAGDWHQDVAHEADQNTDDQDNMVQGNQRFFEGVFVDLIAKLDAVTTSSGTLLDHTLVQWTHESGPTTHDCMEMPIITAGSAGGMLSTGNYADYRDRRSPARTPSGARRVTAYTGLMYNQWLGTVLQTMGLPREDFERDGWGGYGIVHIGDDSWYPGNGRYGSSVLAVMGDRLPFIA